MSESLRELIKRDIEAYEDGLEMEKEPTESTGNPSRPEMKVAKISYDGRLGMTQVTKINEVRI